MSLQLILGASGAGKSHYIYNKIINESMANPDTNYILLVPEQYSMLLQRKMVMLNPVGGAMNIDVIGFNRLAYRVFDEQGVKTAKVLEDFGKSMLIRQVAGSVKDKLKLYGSSLDKPGFIDEVKSLMSELYQYDLGHGKIGAIAEALKENNEEDTLLGKKIADMSVIFDAFLNKLGKQYIVAEEITELLADCIDDSMLIKNSVIVMDGFTGFTPIQYRVIEKLLYNARKVYGVFTIDKAFYDKKTVKEHELFYLTRKTMTKLKEKAISHKVDLCDDIVIEGSGFGKNEELCHLERNLFRYPYKKYEAQPDNIHISSYVNLRSEISGVADVIRGLVMREGYRYKDFAIITANFEETEEIVKQIMPLYDIPFFLDYSRPVKNNPYIDAICHMLKAVRENFSYDAIFAFIKSGVVSELNACDVETLENYVLAHGIKGLWMWNRKWKDETDFARAYIIEIAKPFIMENGRLIKTASVKNFTSIILEFMEILDYENRLTMEAEKFFQDDNVEMSKLYGMLYAKICELLDKMEQIMGDDIIDIRDFEELFLLGLKDLSLGIIPTCLDMITIGDITRTRLDGIKVLFILDANDGILCARPAAAQIISDRDKEKLSRFGFELADTEKQNAYIEQFYLYVNMTKPSDRLYISYITANSENEEMRPSYIINRVCNIFPLLETVDGGKTIDFSGTKATGVDSLIDGLKAIMAGNDERLYQLYGLYKLYYDSGEKKLLEQVRAGLLYHNLPEHLADDVHELIRLKLTSLSVSRLEQYASCAYGYFLKYVLGLKEREMNTLDDRNFGTLLHAAMEKLYRHVHDNLDNAWETVSDNERDRLVERFVEEVFDKEFDAADGKLLYFKDTLKRIGKRTAAALYDITVSGRLKPEYFEYRFKEQLEETITITGIVDRGDVYYSSEENSIKLRIIDYKSGNHDFKISELYEGLQLQLSVYMNIMLDLVREQNKRNGGTAEVVPEGMYYYQMQDPFVDVESDSEEDIKAARDKKLVLKGISDNPEYIKNVSDFAMKKTRALAKVMLEGMIEKAPMQAGDKTACTYCPYKDVCRFDNKYGGNHYRYKKYKDKERDLVYKKILEELGGEDDALD
ncbi:MAG: PD-(D/E)XK nuclease family protein [Clostridium sp.]|nr:PD-(D/E)XK nuclease family protein [Clostridium sp.]MCM1209275.1 PD-(D/E)XK nuclease family protein [Ruminococcus sp.]